MIAVAAVLQDALAYAAIGIAAGALVRAWWLKRRRPAHCDGCRSAAPRHALPAGAVRPRGLHLLRSRAP